jgi:hypothetical protein
MPSLVFTSCRLARGSLLIVRGRDRAQHTKETARSRARLNCASRVTRSVVDTSRRLQAWMSACRATTTGC